MEWRCPNSPIVIDIQANGFHLTDAANGVDFDMDGDGKKTRMSWTAPDTDDAWLALDRNGNTVIDNGAELFGNFTAQPSSDTRNGFIALAELDRPQNGGNDDDVIDARDTTFMQLRLWRDTNHDGVSQSHELTSLPALGVY
jgi:hypothetical protein